MTAFKDAGLEYIALQAENFLENNLLESLDEEVIEELDAVVRDNQLAHSPYVRSGRAELLLHEEHPELAQDIDDERQRRVRDMAFKANQKEEERKLSSLAKGKFGSLEDFSPVSPALEKQASKIRTGRNEPFSPNLRPKATQADLIFVMDDDEGPLDSPSIRPRLVSDERKQSSIDQIPALAASYKDQKQKAFAQSPLARPPDESPLEPPRLDAKPATMTPGKSSNPWISTALPTAKLDLRDIMNETSPGTSALSAGLAAQKAKEASAAKSQSTKISQKERKRQQLLQAEQAAKAALVSSARTPWEKSPSNAKSSPWKALSNESKPSLKDSPTETSMTAPPNTKPLVTAETSGQSIPRRTQSPDTRHSGQSRTPTRAPPLRSPKPAVTTSTFSSDMSSKPVVPHSKSYIKPVSKSELTLGLSMADIIDQEKRNRDMVKEAAAKRSLMEIQQEQAFQEWWDEESRRTQEAETLRLARERERENDKAARGRRGKGGKAKGGRGSGGSGSGSGSGPSAGTVNTRAVEGETASQQNHEHSRGRGNRRGRGRGGTAKVSS